MILIRNLVSRASVRRTAAGLFALAALAPRPASAHCHVQYQVIGPGGLFYQVDIGPSFSYLGVLPGGTTTQLGASIAWTDIRMLEVYNTIQVGLTATDLTGSVACAPVTMSLNGPPSCTDDAVPEINPPCTPSFTITQTGPNSYGCASTCASHPQPHVQPVQFDTPPNSPAPALAALAPSSAPVQSPALALAISGSGFVGASLAEWNGTPLTTVFLDGSNLLALVPPALFASSGTVNLSVLNTGGASGPVAFTVASTAATLGSPLPPPIPSTATAPTPPAPNDPAPTVLASTGRVYPNPWRISSGSPGVTFDHLPPGAGIKLFSLTGRLVKALDASGGTAVWDLTNQSGQSVASGYYFYLITDSGGRHRGRLALVR
jgi:hypothetical protein